MPTVHRTSGYNFVIYTHDHAPAHIHVQARGNDVKVLLEPVTVDKVRGFNRSEISSIMSLVVEYRELLLAEWDKYYDTR